MALPNVSACHGPQLRAHAAPLFARPPGRALSSVAVPVSRGSSALSVACQQRAAFVEAGGRRPREGHPAAPAAPQRSVRAHGRFSGARPPVSSSPDRELTGARRQDPSAAQTAANEHPPPAPVELTLPDPIPEKWRGLSEAEILRRMRISQANRGKKAWNTGRKHSEATKEKIRQRTREAMKRPEVIEKLKAMKHPKHNEEIKEKIRQSLKQFHDRRGRKHPKLTEEQKEARRAQAKVKRSEAMKKRNAEKRAAADAAGGSRRAPPRDSGVRSEEHRAKISMAIKKKWADPEYRSKVTKSLSTSTSSRHADKRAEALQLRKDELLAQKRELMRANAKELVAKASATVQKLEQQMGALQGNPMLQMKAQAALENARGVLKKAQARVSKVEMEIAMAANAALDSWDQVQDEDLGVESAEGQDYEENEPSSTHTAVAHLPPDISPSSTGIHADSPISSASLEGATESSNGQSLHVNGKKQLAVNGHSHGSSLKVNGSHLKVNGHDHEDKGSVAVPGEPLVDGQLVKAFVEDGRNAPGPVDEDIMDDDDQEQEAKAARRQPTSGGTLFGNTPSGERDVSPPPADGKVWRNGRLVSLADPAADQPEQ